MPRRARARRKPLCAFQVVLDHKDCKRPGYYFLRLKTRGRVLPGTCHATSHALAASQRALARVFGCRMG